LDTAVVVCHVWITICCFVCEVFHVKIVVLIRVAIEIPKVEVRFEHLFVEGDAFNGTRALPTLVNSTMNAIQVLLYSSECVVEYVNSLLVWFLTFWFSHELKTIHMWYIKEN